MEKRDKTLQRYVSDMLSVERHIHSAVERQLDEPELSNHPQAQRLIGKIDVTLEKHISILEQHLKALGGDPSKTVKDKVTDALGQAAGMIDKVRNDKVSTELRDDYTALNLASVSYTMLHTTGLSLQHQGTADLARDHLMDLTPLITEINEVIPHVVARELVDEAENANPNVGVQAVQNTQKAWDAEHVHQGHQHAMTMNA